MIIGEVIMERVEATMVQEGMMGGTGTAQIAATIPTLINHPGGQATPPTIHLSSE